MFIVQATGKTWQRQISSLFSVKDDYKKSFVTTTTVAAAGYDLLNSSKLLLKPLSSLMSINSTSALTPTATSSGMTFILPSTPSPASPSLKRASTQSVDSLISDVNSQRHSDSVNVVQSAESVAKVGKLPAETLAVLNKLPAKIFLPNTKGNEKDSPRVIDVVKVVKIVNDC
jgi:hypothetical protein